MKSNYIVIQGWMVSELNLSGNDLLVFGLIYGFCQDGESEFTGSIKYVCDWLNCTRPTAMKALQNLVSKGLILKESKSYNNVVFNRYKISLEVVKKLSICGKETLLGGSKETLPNNTNLDNTIKHKQKKEIQIPAYEEFLKYALEKDSTVDKQNLKLKYQAWIENDWNDGFGKKIVNWKSKLLNTLPHIPKQNNTQTSQNQISYKNLL